MAKSLGGNDVQFTQDELNARLVSLKAEMRGIDDDYVGYVSRTANLAQTTRGGNQLNAMNMFYQYQLLSACVAPFMEGIDAESISRAGGTFIGAYLCSKNFRKMVKDMGKQRDMAKAQKQLDKLDRWQEKHERELPPRKKAKHDALVMKLNNGRMPFTAKSAALTHLGFAQKAYADMRKPGADVDKIEADYNKAVKALYETAQADGCSPREVARSFRTAVGIAAEADPSVNAMFRETCYGGCKPYTHSEYETEMTEAGPMQREYAVFNGDYRDPNGNSVNMFHIRKPQPVQEHIEMFDRNVSAAFERAGGDGEAFAYEYEGLVQNGVAWTAAIHDDMPDSELAEMTPDLIYSMTKDITDRAMSGDTPEMREQMLATPAAHEEELEEAAKGRVDVHSEINAKYSKSISKIDADIEALSDRHDSTIARFERDKASAKKDDVIAAIDKQIEAENKSYEHQRARLEKQKAEAEAERNKELEQRDPVSDVQKKYDKAYADIDAARAEFGEKFLSKCAELHPEAESLADVRSDIVSGMSHEELLSKYATEADDASSDVEDEDSVDFE